jgi:hypothetical protein
MEIKITITRPLNGVLQQGARKRVFVWREKRLRVEMHRFCPSPSPVAVEEESVRHTNCQSPPLYTTATQLISPVSGLL